MHFSERDFAEELITKTTIKIRLKLRSSCTKNRNIHFCTLGPLVWKRLGPQNRVFMFGVQCCNVCYDFQIKSTFGSHLPPIVCRMAHVLFYITCVCLCIVVLCFVFLRLVYPMLPVSPDCPFLIAPSVFSNVFVYSLPRVIVLKIHKGLSSTSKLMHKNHSV